MVTIASLWLAIVLSAVLVWIVSALVWMVFPHHKKDYKGLPNEDEVMKAITGNIKPGMYNLPHILSQQNMKKEEVRKRYEEGPLAYMTVLPKGVPKMGKNMIFSFLYYIVISFFVAFLLTRTLNASAEYLSVFRVTGTVAWLAYGWAVIPDAIWFGKPWPLILKQLIDSLIYALLTAGIFSWQWIS